MIVEASDFPHPVAFLLGDDLPAERVEALVRFGEHLCPHSRVLIIRLIAPAGYEVAEHDEGGSKRLVALRNALGEGDGGDLEGHQAPVKFDLQRGEPLLVLPLHPAFLPFAPVFKAGEARPPPVI